MIELDVLNAMLAAGSTAKEIVRYIEATERVKSEKAAERRVKDRARKRKVRAQEKSAKSTTVSDGQVRTGADIADKKEGFPQTPSQENNYPSPPKGGPSQTARRKLETVLDAEHAEAVIDHRKSLRAPLTAFAAARLAEKFSRFPDPNAAAEAMVANGWKNIEPEWLENRKTAIARAAAPPRSGSPRNLSEFAIQKLMEIEHDD